MALEQAMNNTLEERLHEPQPEVSVVITTRNRKAWLEQCIGSVLCQKEVKLRVIVIDDHSDDGTWEWLSYQKDPRILSIRNDVHMERAYARNVGLNNVSSPYVMFLDDDDQLWPNALSHLSKTLDKQSSAVAAIGARQAWFVVERYRRREPHPRQPLLWESRMDVIFGWCVTGGQVVLRTEAARSFGGFRAEFTPCEDREFWFNLSLLGPFAFIPQTVLTYRQHPGQTVDANRNQLRQRVAQHCISALPSNQRERAVRLRKAKQLCDKAESLMMSGETLRGLLEMGRGFLVSKDMLRSPLLNEWVLRWLIGRGVRYYLPPRDLEREGSEVSCWRCAPGALARHPDAPIIHPGVRANPIVVQFSGGTGNQLFQYAAALVLASQTGSAIICVPSDSPLRATEPGIEQLIGSLPRAKRIDLLRFALLPFLGFPRVRRLWRRLTDVIRPRHILWQGKGEFRETIQRPIIGSGILLTGFFQSLDWVEEALDAISKMAIQQIPNGFACKPEVMAIHMRTGVDFQGNGWVLPMSYYRAALQRQDPHRELSIWVIGDCNKDTETLALLLRNDGWRIEKPPIHADVKMVDDFWSLVAAQNLILSNSTFAWWAAAVGDHLHTTSMRNVIFPEPWLPCNRQDLRKPNWKSHQIAYSGDD